MGRKKKSFIDKQNASTYHLVRRSQRDIELMDDDEGKEGVPKDFVLMPSPNNKKNYTLDYQNNKNEKEKEELSEGGDKQKQNKSAFQILGDKLRDYGLAESDYDYSQHTRAISNSGVFMSAAPSSSSNHNNNQRRGVKLDPTLDPRSWNVNEGEGEILGSSNHNQIQEVDRHLESIALTANCMDEDIAEALFGDWSENDEDGDDGNEGGAFGGFEEILDDFVLTASKEVPPDESGALEENDGNYFDYDAHIAHLMKQAQLQARGDSKSYLPSELAQSHEWAQKTHDFFKDAKQLQNKKKATMNDDDHEDDDEDDDSWDAEEYPDEIDAVVPALSPEDEQALCSKFEEALAEYDSDEVGDLNEECEEIVGDRPLEGDAYVENALDEFLDEQKDLSFMHGSKESYREKMKEKKQIQGSSFSVLVGKRLVPAKELDHLIDEQQQENKEEDINESLMEATRILSHPKMQPPEEDVLIDGKSYFSQKEVNPWDCESILTTYSNLDNNPVTISSTRSNRRRKNKKQQVNIDPVEEEGNEYYDDNENEERAQYQQIQLSNKTGLPMGVLPVTASKNHDDDDTSNAVANKGAARNRKETKEEKKARKVAAKQEKMISRLEKKMMKAAFADEFMKRSSDVTTNDVGGKTVFRYS